MKKLSLGFIAGLVVGGTGTWTLTHSPSGPPTVEPANAAIPAVTAGVRLSADQARAAGVATARPSKTRLTHHLIGYARVIDPLPLFALVSEIETADTAATASAKELARVRQLNAEGENASARVVETAEAAASRDRSLVASAHARLRVGWGDLLSETKSRGDLLRDLSARAAALVRVDLAAGDAPARAPTELQLERLAGAMQAQSATVLGPAPLADVQFQGVGYLAVVRDPLPPGTLLRALVPSGGGDTEALLVPASAIVRHQGSTLVFVKSGDGAYARRIVTVGQSQKDAISIIAGLSATDEVVVTGAQQLLSYEQLSAPSGS